MVGGEETVSLLEGRGLYHCWREGTVSLEGRALYRWRGEDCMVGGEGTLSFP